MNWLSAIEHEPVKHLVHGARRLGAPGFAHDLGWHSGDRDIVRDRLDDNRPGGDARAMPDFDIAKDLGAGADHHATTDFRVTVLVLLAGAAERYIVQDRHVILNHRGLSDDESGCVIDENAAADFCSRINVTLEYRRGATLQIEREILSALFVEPMRETMRLDRVETLVIEHRFDEAAGRRVAVDRGDNIGPEGIAERGLGLKRVVVGLTDHVRRYVRVPKPLTDAVGNRSFQGIVVQDVFINEGSEFGLAPRDILRFAADARPDRIDLVEAPHGPCLKFSHGQISRPLDPLDRSFIIKSKTHRVGVFQHHTPYARWLRKLITPALKTLSPTASMWSRPGIFRCRACGTSAASACADPAIGSLLPTATITGARIVATSARVSVCRDPRMHAASARRSDLVCSAKLRNMRPVGSCTSPGDGASRASAMLSGRPTPSTSRMPRPPKMAERTRVGRRTERNAVMRAPIE